MEESNTNCSSSTKPEEAPKPSKLELYKQKVTQDPWRLKLYDLQDRINQENLKLEQMLADLKPEEEAKLPEEEQKKRKEEFGVEFKKHRLNINTLKKEEQEHRMNKTMSQFFEWIPNTQLNRRARKGMAKMRGKK